MTNFTVTIGSNKIATCYVRAKSWLSHWECQHLVCVVRNRYINKQNKIRDKKKYSKTILIKLFYCQILISCFTIYYCYTTRYNIATGCKDRDWILDSPSKIDKFKMLDKQNNVFMHYGQCCVLESKQSWISIGKAVERSWQFNIFLEGKAFFTVKNCYFLSVLNNIYFVEYTSQHNYF